MGKIPALLDFERYGTLDVLRIFDSKSLGSYYMFLKKYEKDFDIRLTDMQEQMLEYVSKKFASGKRPHELVLLQTIMEKRHDVWEAFASKLYAGFGISLTPYSRENLFRDGQQ